MKKYIIIAGVNGAGKSILFQTQYHLKNIQRINTDEILKKFGDWKNPTDLMKAGKMTVEKLKECLDSEISFNHETTLCGHSIFRLIETAISKGYYVEMHYIGLDSSEIAKERVRCRVKKGGHGIPDTDIDRRYKQSFENLKLIIPLCSLVALYDNTMNFRRFAIYKSGKLARLSQNVPLWWYRENFTDY